MTKPAAYHQTPGQAPPAPTGCPVQHEWDPLSPAYLTDPYGIATSLSEESPIFYAESLGYVVVTRMDDIIEVFQHPDIYASTNVQDPVFPLSQGATEVLSAEDFDPVAVMSNRPEPDHGRIRVHTQAGFSNKRLKELEPYVRRRSHELIDAMVAGAAPAEFIDAFAYPLPGETVFRFLGFPESDDEMLKDWCGERKAFSWGHATEDEQVEIAGRLLAYWRYCRDFVASKKENRGSDFASELIDVHEADNSEISYREVESIVYGLSFAGHEAVTNLICNCLWTLLSRRDQWDAICADPSLINNTVEEVLRFESSQISWRRVTAEPTTLGGIDLPVGTQIFLNFAAANHQADLFEDPDTFDIHRSNANRHISFGRGIHFCLGAKMVRFEARIVLEVLSQRLPSLRLVDGQDFVSFPNITFRGPESMYVTWD